MTQVTEPKYPKITVKVLGKDGNAFAILGRVKQALKDARVEKPEIEAFFAEATSGDYDHLLQAVMRWVEVR